jgi:hypothetical protein
MLKSEVQVGKVYVARINGRLTKVRIDAVVERQGYTSPNSYRQRPTVTHWAATNLTTNRRIELKSAAKLIREDKPVVQPPQPRKSPLEIVNEAISRGQMLTREEVSTIVAQQGSL